MLKQIAWGIVLFTTLLIGTAWADDALNQKLFTAVEAGDKATTEALLAQGADVKSTDTAGFTPLFRATNKNIEELLIANGANVNAKNQDSWTPLHWYVRSATPADKSVVGRIELLIAKGANVNAKDKDGLAPFNYAVGQGNKDIAALLISKGADVNVKDKDGNTPLFSAAYQGNTDMVKLLIAHGADVNAKDKEGDTALLNAARAKQGGKDVAELLIAKGADVNARKFSGLETGWTPLHLAVLNENTELVELLIAKGADINAGKASDATPFETPLVMAIENRKPDMAKLLIAKGADVNAKATVNDMGNMDTPLFAAVIKGNKDMVELLIAKGADVNVKDQSNHTLVEMAGYRIDDSKKKQEIVDILQAAMAKSMDKQAGNDLPTLMAQFKGHTDNEVVRAAIINLALKQHPAPAIPAEAEDAAGRGAYIFKNAKTMDDTLSAAKEYLTAIELAPWVANYYYNLCTVLEKTPYTQQALHACKLYLVAAPNAADASDMRQRIAGLQYATDKNKAQMQQRTAYIKPSGMDDMYRFGGITGSVSGNDVTLKLFVDWDSAPPKYQVYVGCFSSDGDVYGRPHDLVSTDDWIQTCHPTISLHLVIKPEGAGFVELSDASGNGVRATLDDLFAAKQKTMGMAPVFSAAGDQGDRYYVTYVQGGHDLQHAGYLMYESDCNGSVLSQDPRALPDDFISAEVHREGGFGKYYPEVVMSQPNTDVCNNQFVSKTGYHFGESE